MEYYFIRIARGGYTTIKDPKSKPRLICFKDLNGANECVKYMSCYRSRFGLWPDIDLSKPFMKIKSETDFKKRTPYDVEKFMYVDKKTEIELDEMAKQFGISYFYCHDFKYDKLKFSNLQLRGQEYDGYVDDEMYRHYLDYSLKIE